MNLNGNWNSIQCIWIKLRNLNSSCACMQCHSIFSSKWNLISTKSIHFSQGESTPWCTRNSCYNVHFGSFSSAFLNAKVWKKHKNLETMLKLTFFSMSKLMVPHFQPFWITLFSIGHEKHPFGYVMNLEKKKTFITHSKVL